MEDKFNTVLKIITMVCSIGIAIANAVGKEYAIAIMWGVISILHIITFILDMKQKKQSERK